jgi:hypothetical protein
VEVVDVEVDHVERRGLLVDLLEHQHVVGELIDAARVKPQRAWTRRHEPRARHGIAAREERDVVTQSDELLGQVETTRSVPP